MKSLDRLLWSAVRERVGFHKSKNFERWLKARQLGSWHHPFGSYGSRKTTDLASVMIPEKQHAEMQDNQDFNTWLLPQMFKNIIDYAIYLESEIKRLEDGK